MNSIFILIRFLFLVILVFHGILIAQNDSIAESDWEAFPIINYDTDVGFGYGVKAFFYNFLEKGESFDLTVYNSTKGERWYRLVYSVPDKLRRQGKKYDAALDIILDYDKWINYLFYFDSRDYNSLNYPGNLDRSNKKFEDYVREPIEISAIFSSALTKDFIAEIGVRYKSISCYQFEHKGNLHFNEPSNVQHISLLFSFRLDTRNNLLNPQKGILLQINNELARDILKQEQSFFKIGLTFQSYFQIIYPELIFASRIILQAETDAPYQNLLSLGGNNSVRGLPQDRYLSQSFSLLNEELRFPIWWKIGGIIGVDIGNSPSTPEWIINPAVGLRLTMENFIVRADLGFGKESTGFYFNFGQLF
jgi:outer membrane protein assembly factor BamA